MTRPSSKAVPSPGGCPARDNFRRLQARKLNRLAVVRIRTLRGRRRKKHLTKAETVNFKNLIIAVARDLAQQKAAAS